MKLLIGCLSLNTKNFTEIWIETLLKSLNNNYNNIKIVILDNGSNKENNLIDLQNKYQQIKFLFNKENLGVSSGWNSLIKEGYSNGEFLYDYYLICNNDIYWTEYSLINLIKSLENTKHNKVNEYGWISLMQNDYKEDSVKIPQIQQLEQYYWKYRPHADNVKSKEQMLDLIDLSYSAFGGIEAFADKLNDYYGPHIHELHPKATCFALSKECIQKVGLFDEYNIPVGLHEDVDYCIRVKQAGLKFGACYNAYIHHFSMMSRTRSDITTGDSWVNAREKAFQEKWGCSSKDTSNLKPVVKVDIGSGQRPQDEGHWYHLDIDKHFGHVEYLHDCSKPLPFRNDSIDEIYCSNNLEHIFHKDILIVLKDWYDKLKVGGKIEIRVPNFRFAVGRYLDKSWSFRFDGGQHNLMHLLMGGEAAGPQHIHKCIFDFDILSKLLIDVGFKNIKDISCEGSWELRTSAEK